MTTSTDECLIDARAITPARGNIAALPIKIGKSITFATWSCVARLIEWRAVKRLERDLQKLDDRMLKDIGLDRSEVRRAVYFGQEL